MPERRLTPDELRYMALFQDITGATVKDCVIDDEYNRIIFVVGKGDVGKAVGRKGSNIRKLKKIMGRDIEVVAEGETIEDMARNAVSPARVKQVRTARTGNRTTVYIHVDSKDKGTAIGKNGKNVARARMLLKRYFDVDNVVIK